MPRATVIAVLSVVIPVLVALAAFFVMASGCNGHGKLTSAFKCECDPIWGGSRCERCLCLFGRCPSKPAGPFHANSRCECDDMWDGALCNVCCVSPPATGKQCLVIDKVEGNLVQCNGNKCVENFFAPKCHKFCERTRTCNGHGKCNAAGDCECDDGYGLSVETNTCEPCAKQCSNNGKCQYGPECACNANHFGPDCSKECKCDSVGGECVCNEFTCATGSCRCNTDAEGNPLYVGSDCSTACPVVNGLSCNGKGKCLPSGTCECQPGFKGPFCNCQDELTCNAPRGACSESGGCLCQGNFDPAANCSECLPDFYGSTCSRYCNSLDTCSGFSCIEDGMACDCEERGRDPLMRATVCESNTERVFFNSTQPVLLQLQRPANCPQIDLIALVKGQERQFAPNDAVDLRAEDYGVQTPALVSINVTYETLKACDRCMQGYYPLTGNSACTTYCTKALCNFQGDCDEDGTCSCNKHVDGDFCEKCTGDKNNQYNFGPEPASEQNDACINFCYASAQNFSQCFEKYVQETQSSVTLLKAHPCDSNTLCSLQANSSVIACKVQGILTPCYAPSLGNSNENALGSAYASLTLSNGQNLTCNFCNGNGLCEGGECLCNGENVIDTNTYAERQRIVGEVLGAHERLRRVPSGYHGPHCFLTCGEGSDASCSGNGQCVWDTTVNAPRCLCDPAQELASMWLAQNQSYTACIKERFSNCTQLKPSSPFPKPLFFGKQCEFHAPFFYYKTGEGDVVTSVCAGQQVERQNTYALQGTDGTWIVYDNRACENDKECSEEQSSDTFCDLDAEKPTCVKLTCNCGTARGGRNCGQSCAYPVEICTGESGEQECVTSQCGERFPIVTASGTLSIKNGDKIACQHGKCVANDKRQDGNSFETPATNFKPVPGTCTCARDADRSSSCNNNITALMYLEKCCAQGPGKYGPGYCSQDCDCPDMSKGSCDKPFSNLCTCNSGQCGQDCESTCQSCGTHGVCVTKGSRACQCACAAGYVNKVQDIGLDVALYYSGASCSVQCPGVDNIKPPYDKIANLPTPSDTAETQLNFWNAYRAAQICNGHGACTPNVNPGQCECMTGYAGQTCNVSCTNAAQPPCLQSDKWCDGSMSVCNHGQCTVQSSEQSTKTCMCDANFETKPSTYVTSTTFPLCNKYTLGLPLPSSTGCTFCAQGNVPPCTQCKQGFFTSGDISAFATSSTDEIGNSVFFGSCSSTSCPVKNCNGDCTDVCVKSDLSAIVRAQMVRTCADNYKTLCDAESNSRWPPVNNLTDFDYLFLSKQPYCDCNFSLASVQDYDASTNPKCKNCTRQFTAESHCYECNSTSFWVREPYYVGQSSGPGENCVLSRSQDCPQNQMCSKLPADWAHDFYQYPYPDLLSTENRGAVVSTFLGCHAPNANTVCINETNPSMVFDTSRTLNTMGTFQCIDSSLQLSAQTFNCVAENYTACSKSLFTGSYCEIDLQSNAPQEGNVFLPFTGLSSAFGTNPLIDNLVLLSNEGGCTPIVSKGVDPFVQSKWFNKTENDYLYLTGDTCTNMLLKEDIVEKYATNLTYRHVAKTYGFNASDFITGSYPKFQCVGLNIENNKVTKPGHCQWSSPSCYDIASSNGVPVKTPWDGKNAQTIFKIVKELDAGSNEKQWLMPEASFDDEPRMYWVHFTPDNLLTCGGYEGACNASTQVCSQCDSGNIFMPQKRCQDSTVFANYVKRNTIGFDNTMP